MHDPVVQALTGLMDHVIPADRVLAERPRSYEALASFMRTVGSRLGKRPDLVLRDWDGPTRHLAIDVKTFDPAGASHVGDRHTDTRRLAAHSHLEQSSVAAYHDPITGRLPPSFRLLIFTVSISGAIGDPGRAFLGEASRRLGRSLPTSLLDEATWATPHFGPFARMAIAFSVRRALAHSLRRWWGTADQVDQVVPPEAQRAARPLPPIVLPCDDSMDDVL